MKDLKPVYQAVSKEQAEVERNNGMNNLLFLKRALIISGIPFNVLRILHYAIYRI